MSSNDIRGPIFLLKCIYRELIIFKYNKKKGLKYF